MNAAEPTGLATLQVTYGILVGTLPGALTMGVLDDLRQGALEALANSHVRGVVFDVSAVEVMDAGEYQCLCDTARMCGIMGQVQVILCGLRPGVVAALVDMGIDSDAVEFRRSLEDSLQSLRGSTP